MTELVCDKCGAEIPPEARFCPNCGDPVSQADHVQESQAPVNERVNLICPKCEQQTLMDVEKSGDSQQQCPQCEAIFWTRLREIRSKTSRGSKKEGTRSFSIRVKDLVGNEELIEFSTGSYDDFELRSKDLAAFSYIDQQLTVVQNLTVGHSMKIEKGGCFIATFAFGPKSPEVQILHRWRDETLLGSRYSAWLVSVYYAAGPHFLRIMPDSKFTRKIVQFPLRKVVRWVSSPCEDPGRKDCD